MSRRGQFGSDSRYIKALVSGFIKILNSYKFLHPDTAEETEQIDFNDKAVEVKLNEKGEYEFYFHPTRGKPRNRSLSISPLDSKQYSSLKFLVISHNGATWYNFLSDRFVKFSNFTLIDYSAILKVFRDSPETITFALDLEVK